MKKRIKEYAVNNGVIEFKRRCGINTTTEELDTTLLTELSELLPKHRLEFIKGKVDKISTDSFSVGRSDYFPEGSFYRISIVYGGKIPKEMVELNEYGKEDKHGKKYGHFFLRNSTVHFDIEMNFISVQHHHNQSSYNWLDYSSQFDEIFRNLK